MKKKCKTMKLTLKKKNENGNIIKTGGVHEGISPLQKMLKDED